MKARYIAAAAAAALAIGLTSAPVSSEAQGKPTTKEVSLPVSGTVPVPQDCQIGESTLTFSGNVRVVATVHKDGSGRNHVRVTLKSQNVTATGSSGTVYRVQGQVKLNVKSSENTSTSQVQAVVMLKGQGSAPNFRLHVNGSVTVSSTGDVSANVNNLQVVCK